MSPDDTTATESRAYHSPLRQAQADRTRVLIIEALTDLLFERPTDEISTKDIAEHAGVSERTVYRHYPERRGLHEALAAHWVGEHGPDVENADSLGDLAELIAEAYLGFEAQARETVAMVAVNADPRRPASDTARRSARWVEVTARSFPDLDERQSLALAAITRMFGSSQTWLRLREEFGIRGAASAALASWAMRALIEEVQRGNPPPAV